MRRPAVGGVEHFVVRREAQAVGLKDIIGDHFDLAALTVDAVDGFFQVQLAFLAFVIHQAAVARVGEPDVLRIRMDDGIVRCVERLAVPFVGQNG